MSEKERKLGSFVLFKNDYKKTGDKQPDYKSLTKQGDRGLNLDGTEIEVACWVNKSASGVSYMSCNIQVPRNEVAEVVEEDSNKGDLPF